MVITMQDPIYFHCDCNSYFASVEETFHPEYKKVPMAVAGDPANRRGIILAKNELAKKYGIKTAETINSAKQKCPELLLCPPRRGEYGEFCDRINSIYETYSNFVERFSIDESFLDMTFFRGDELAIAHEIRERVARETGITISIGVKTIGDLANLSEAYLLKQFGKQGEYLHASANGLDDTPIAHTGEHDPAKSIGNGKTFRRDLTSEQDIRTGLLVLADSVAARMRHAGVKCTTVQVTIKDTALKSITRQKTVRPTFLAADLVQACLDLIHASWPKGKPIRLLTITAQNLLPAEEAVEQISLFDAPSDTKKTEQLERAVDGIREKHGGSIIQHGSVLRNDLGIETGEDG